MTPSDVSAGVVFESAGSQWSRSWWRWIAYALAPFGWAVFPTPEFIRKQTRRQVVEEDLLAGLSLKPSCGGSPQTNYRVAEEWLVGELGSPETSGESREWRYEWGSVGLMYEPIDGVAEAYVAWEPFASELQAEIEERIRS